MFLAITVQARGEKQRSLRLREVGSRWRVLSTLEAGLGPGREVKGWLDQGGGCRVGIRRLSCLLSLPSISLRLSLPSGTWGYWKQ